MALSPRANATVGPPKEVTSSSANPKTVYPSSSLHHEVVRSADLSCSASLFGDLDAQRLPLSNFRMELPQSQHSFEGSKPPHDFLSLYGDSSSNCVEHRSSQGISTYLTTQDFLQPLERGGKDVVSSAETSAAAPTTTSGEHVLPGGIGTYTISHVSSYNHTNAKSDPPVVHVNGTEGKPEVTRGSTSSNYAGGGFKLWEERIVVDGGRTDGLAESDSTKEYLEKSGYWSTVRPKVGVSDLSFLAKTSFSLSSVEVNQQLLPSSSKLLDTLTQALQSSGLDLSQANISVQIELGRRGGTSMATTNIKEHSQNQEESSQTHQLQGQSRAADTASECEQPPKRPKIERDL